MSFASVFSQLRPVSLHRAPARAARAAGRSPRAVCSLLLATAALLPGVSHAQSPGTKDATFLSILNSGTVFSIVAGPPLGSETSVGGGDATLLGVLNETGLLATGFAIPEFGSPGRIVYIVTPEVVIDSILTGPKILVGGKFGKNQYSTPKNGPAQNITRIDLAGTIDTTFNPGEGADDFVTAILPQADGTIFVGGVFSNFNKQAFPHIVRLNRDGSIDTDFQRVNVGDSIFALAAQIDPTTGAPNGQILLAGDFSSIGNDAYTKLARLDQAGNLDTSFKPVIDSRVTSIAVQPNGKIVIGGQFSSINGQTVGHLARLNMDGTLDTTFNASVSVVPAQTTAPVAAYTLRLLPDGRLYVGGQFSAVDGAPRQYLGRIESDGSLDTNFDPGTSITNSVQSVAVQDDNKVLVAETVSKKINNNFPPSLIRLFGDTVTTTALPAVELDVKVDKARARADGTRVNGQFELFRTAGDLTAPLNVYFEVSGTAQSGVAYRPLAATQYAPNVYRVTFPANQTTLKVKVKPLPLEAADAPESLTFTLLPSQDGADPYLTGKQVKSFAANGDFVGFQFSGASAVGTLEISNTK